jgi:hypothetical protein
LLSTYILYISVVSQALFAHILNFEIKAQYLVSVRLWFRLHIRYGVRNQPKENNEPTSQQLSSFWLLFFVFEFSRALMAGVDTACWVGLLKVETILSLEICKEAALF